MKYFCHSAEGFTFSLHFQAIFDQASLAVCNVILLSQLVVYPLLSKHYKLVQCFLLTLVGITSNLNIQMKINIRWVFTCQVGKSADIFYPLKNNCPCGSIVSNSFLNITDHLQV